MPQSPEITGGEGFTFEGNVAAFYLAALLAEACESGTNNKKVIRVSFQQRNYGEPLDDVIVDFEDDSKDHTEKNFGRLSLQVKHSLTISSAKSNEAFREIVCDSWATFKKSDFRPNIDRYGAAVGRVALAKEQALIALCEGARESLTADCFHAKFTEDGSASSGIRKIKSDIVTLLKEIKGSPCTREEEHQFIAHFIIIRFDFLHKGAVDTPRIINRIECCLALDNLSKAQLVWSRLIELARISAGKSGQFDRMRLISELPSDVRLRGATSLRPDLDRLNELAKSNSSLISDDIAGIRLDRTSLLEEVEAKLTTARIVLISGLPGNGKSVLVKRAVQRALENGPVIFLKAEQLEGKNWISYATSQGLSGANLEKLLVEIGVVGTPVLFIDAIDRIDKAQWPIIIDVIRAIKKSQMLDKWRIVASLRDTGIEIFYDMVSEYIDVMNVEILRIEQMNEEDAKFLAKNKPYLRSLLYDAKEVREIARRPFFAKILHKNYRPDFNTPAFTPQSEVDLIKIWWRRGGYDETGQSALYRRRALIELASVRVRHINQPIAFNKLKSEAYISDLISDGILQNVHEGISVRFAHDIFFEWAFFYTLVDHGKKWMEILKGSGEPPALVRSVELYSQWEYTEGGNWRAYLIQLENSKLRSQWLRAWLVGPLGTAKFETDEDQFEEATFADDFRLFRKILIWFQADKIIPNKSILARSLPQEQRQRYADLLGWPSDFPTWRRFIDFILRRIKDIPQQIYPDIISVFDVWQNAFADLRNPTSQEFLRQCAVWLAAIDNSIADTPDEGPAYWEDLSDLGAFKKSLIKVLLVSSRVEYSFAARYLKRISSSKKIRRDEFHDIIVYSPILAQSLPQSVVDLSLAFLLDELPDERVDREKKAFSGRPYMLAYDHFSIFDWQNHSIHDHHRDFLLPSPLREPFHSLFQSSPDHALKLLRGLCNHAMTAWRQMHNHSHDHGDIPIPLEITFPWGTQIFWGSDREYLWFRSIGAPKAIGCAFMALEEWCFSEIEKNRDVDELIQQVIEGNECIAILGIASMIVLRTERASGATLPLVTSQRLLTADHYRMKEDLSLSMNLLGFMESTDTPHIEAIQAANARGVRKRQLRWMIPKFVFARETFRDRAREIILNFKNDLPFQYEEDRDIPDIRERLTRQALEYAELVNIENYQANYAEDDIKIIFNSPSAAQSENITKAENANKNLRLYSLCIWASKSLQGKKLNDGYTIKYAIVLSKEVDSKDLFEEQSNENDEISLEMRRSAISATAAMVLNFREGCSYENLEWARDILKRAIHLPEKFDLMRLSGSVDSFHQGIFVARCLAADIRENTATCGTANKFLNLVAYPLEVVALSALDGINDIWLKDSKLAWAALIVAFSRCYVPSLPPDYHQQHSEVFHKPNEAQSAVDAALAFYEKTGGWMPLPLPPPAWIKVKSKKDWFGHQRYENYHEDDLVDATDLWCEPDIFWYSMQAKKILNLIPLEEILNSSAKSVFLDFLSGALDWTIQKNAPLWVKSGRRNRPNTEIIEWTDALGLRLGHVAGFVPLDDLRSRFLDPIFELEGDNCWALLSPFTIAYVRYYVYGASAVQDSTVDILDLCLGRFLQASAFNLDTNRSGEFSDFRQVDLVRTLMFVSDERVGLTGSYENSEWTKISRVLPVIDRFVRAGGWAASVMDSFLTFCERTRANYPAEDFAEQVLAVIGDGPYGLRGWHGSPIPSRIAGLVQHFADRDEAPMQQSLAQTFLRILDMLIDMGDRRSAALQRSNAFREVQMLPSS